MTKLHEILAVEGDKEGIAKKILEETSAVFKSKHHLFQGGTKRLEMTEEGNEAIEESSKEDVTIETTVAKRLDYTIAALTDWLDVVLQKEKSNQFAVADIVIDGITIAKGLPATFLLGLESKLKHIRSTFVLAPTLQPGLDWVHDESLGVDIYKAAKLQVKSKTQKRPMSRVLYDATKEHKAQIETWTEDVIVGKFVTQVTSSMMSAADKSEMLARIDLLIQSVKQARMRANNRDIENVIVGKNIFKYIMNS